MNERRDLRIKWFKEDLKAVFERYRLALWLINDECYECDGGTLSIVDLDQGILDLEALAWHDLAAVKAEAARQEAVELEEQQAIEVQRAQNRRLFEPLGKIFQEHEMILWSRATTIFSAVPLTEQGLEKLRQTKLVPSLVRTSMLSPAISERVLMSEHETRLPMFLAAVEALGHETQLLPLPQPDTWTKNPSLVASPLHNDVLPDWLRT